MAHGLSMTMSYHLKIWYPFSILNDPTIFLQKFSESWVALTQIPFRLLRDYLGQPLPWPIDFERPSTGLVP